MHRGGVHSVSPRGGGSHGGGLARHSGSAVGHSGSGHTGGHGLGGGDVAAVPDVFEIRFHGGGEVLAQERPLDKGGRMVFRRHPDGALISVKKSDVVGVTA